ncbi:MAG TPA: hypothetical protein VKU19_07465 [Bryobacteraceae bacterium]|nr:hypothetical protein [Bryobacteraceae bacterium]
MADRKPNHELLAAALAGYKHQAEVLGERIAELRRRLGKVPSVAGMTKPKRKMSESARRRISAAQQKRWAAIKKSGTSAATKRTMTAEGKARIAEATRKRWAEFRAQKAAAR